MASVLCRAAKERNGGFDAQTRKLLQAAMRSATSDDAKNEPNDGSVAVVHGTPKRRRKGRWQARFDPDTPA